MTINVARRANEPSDNNTLHTEPRAARFFLLARLSPRPGERCRYARNQWMNADELFQSTGDAYLALIHLENHVGDAVQKISRACANCPRDLIDQLLLDSPSWRGRNLGLAMATIRGLDQHYNSLIAALIKSGGMSIVPLAAGISVAVRDCGGTYSPNMTEALNRTAWDGEIGFALDWLHFTIGLAGAVKPEFADGPNYGQAFITHLEFYTELNRA